MCHRGARPTRDLSNRTQTADWHAATAACVVAFLAFLTFPAARSLSLSPARPLPSHARSLLRSASARERARRSLCGEGTRVAGDIHTADGCAHWVSLFFMRPMRTCRNCVRAAISLPDCPRSLAVSISVSVSLSLPLSLLLLLSLSTCRSLALSLFARRARTAAPRAAHFSSTAQGSSGGAGGGASPT